jgi:hypothetical protein
VTFEARVAYTYVDAEPATLALRGEERRKAADRGMTPDWMTLTVEGPRQETGAYGVTWHTWTGPVRAA